MGKLYFTSDQHFSHKRIAELRGFDSVDEHDEVIADNLLSTVDKRSTLINLGDLAMTREGFEVAHAVHLMLDCEAKHLVPGNHDGVHPMHSRAARHQKYWLEVFDSVQPYMRMKFNKSSYLISHLPYKGAGDHMDEERYTQYRLPDEGLPLLCGHVHGEWKTNGNCMNVGVDQWDLKPVSFNELEEWMRSKM